uniref:Cathepsin D inhibitor n=1 Tax=Solanum tuberosum TaxID=4113 RepID=Q8RXA3_SOLTU|nr:Kunitz-type enzyme inhibitor P4E1 precursor [Solanum tuberosum]AAL99260.1 Kunitz-type enzyme inhibitor P4E1 precursor [Solanum tuberosum]AIT42154.1 Kunitz-type inhibitor A [Solanum tuberosum]BAC23032.1 cathepsin D inhibitor [Solanum tuberosum]
MMKCLFFLCLCLFPILVFSSTFTSQNPIDLPTDTTPCTPVLDTNGNELNPNSSYRIISTFWGALGGDVYLGKSPNSDAPCPDGVFRYNSDVGPRGTPVRFIPLSGANICEDQLLNIQFNIPTPKLCVSYTIWKVGNLNALLRTMLLETGGTIGQADSSYFKIVKSSKIGYNLLYCPLTPIICPLCPDDLFCAKVGVVIQNGKRRLALVNENPLDVLFQEV